MSRKFIGMKIEELEALVSSNPSDRHLMESIYTELKCRNVPRARRLKLIVEKSIVTTSSKSNLGLNTNNKADNVICPKCGSNMVTRTAKHGYRSGQKFYGCSKYPKCKGLVNINSPSELHLVHSNFESENKIDAVKVTAITELAISDETGKIDSDAPTYKNNSLLNIYIDRLRSVNSGSILLNCSNGKRGGARRARRDRLDLDSFDLYDENTVQIIAQELLTGKTNIALDYSPNEKRMRRWFPNLATLSKLEQEEHYRQKLLECEILVTSLRRNLFELANDARQLESERGYDSLMIGYPVLMLQQPDKEKAPIIAPLFLWPVKIKKDTSSKFEIEIERDRDRPIEQNAALLNWASSNEIGVQIPFVDENVWDDNELDSIELKQYILKLSYALTGSESSLQLNKFSAVPDSSSVKKPEDLPHLSNSGAIGLFVHQKEEILRDLLKLNGDAIPACRILDQFLYTKSNPTNTNATNLSYDLSNLTALKLDFTQRPAALYGSESGSAIIYGPPGTGKSQTISEIIAQSIRSGKRVLICCEKSAAISVLSKRLEKLKLDEWCIYIADAKKDRGKIFNKIRSIKDAVSHTTHVGNKVNVYELRNIIDSCQKEIIRASEILNFTHNSGFKWQDLVGMHSNINRIIQDRGWSLKPKGWRARNMQHIVLCKRTSNRRVHKDVLNGCNTKCRLA